MSFKKGAVKKLPPHDKSQSHQAIKFIFIRYQWITLVLILIAIVAVVVYLSSSDSLDNSEANNLKNPSTQPVATTAMPISISPISPLSPVSPLDPMVTASPIDKEVLQTVFARGQDAYKRGEYEAAKQAFTEVLLFDPSNVFAYDARGSTYTALQDYEKALTDYSKAIELSPTHAQAFYNRGRVYSLLNRFNEALADLQQAIEHSPTEFGYRANGNIGLIYHQQGKYDQALEAFAAALDYDDSKADTYYFRGETYTAMGNYSAAIADYAAALSRFPQYDLAQQGLGYAYYKTKQFDQAMAALDKAAELTPNQPITSFYRMLVYLATNRPDQAKTEANQAIKSLDSLPQDNRETILSQTVADLKTLAKENPDQATVVEEIVNLIPQ